MAGNTTAAAADSVWVSVGAAADSVWVSDGDEDGAMELSDFTSSDSDGGGRVA